MPCRAADAAVAAACRRQVNDYSMELLRAHFDNAAPGKTIVTLAELARQHAGQEEQLEQPLATLLAVSDAIDAPWR